MKTLREVELEYENKKLKAKIEELLAIQGNYRMPVAWEPNSIPKLELSHPLPEILYHVVDIESSWSQRNGWQVYVKGVSENKESLQFRLYISELRLRKEDLPYLIDQTLTKAQHSLLSFISESIP